MRSECCGAGAHSGVENGIGICSECKEWADFEFDDGGEFWADLMERKRRWR